MGQWKCSICGYIHEEAKDGAFSALPNEWVCPWCKAAQSAFVQQGKAPVVQSQADRTLLESAEKELTALEVSVLCSNLAKGCEKQYLPEEAALFTQLAVQFQGQAAAPTLHSMADLLTLVERDLQTIAPLVEEIAKEKADRGALRAHAWNVKVTMILQSLLARYQKEGDAMVENTGVYVCTICGFIYVGDALPTLCPVCKVPNYKFEEIGGE